MAGSASLMLLVLSTMESAGLGIIYILLFGLGSIVGMAIVGGLISMPFVFTSNRFSSINKGIRYATGFFSIAFGTFLMIKIGFIEGLFYF
jgi:high-affinity nickel-transport protein